MDIAKRYIPEIILLWQKAADCPEANRIISLFPDVLVKFIEHQNINPLKNSSMAKALIKGKRILMLGHSNSFVGYFNGNPSRLPEHSDGRADKASCIHCLPYYKLVPVSNGCPYYCTYCYLAFVYRKFSSFIKVNTNHNLMFRQIRKTLKESNGAVTFNMGEMLDSLALDHITNLTTLLVPFFAELSRAYLMLLTKSSSIDNLLKLPPNSHTIISWSLNSQKMIYSFEPGTAGLDERINCASACQKIGYRIRFRIDPGIIYPGWQDDYAELVKKMMTQTCPENITLGMLRILPGHFNLINQAYRNKGKILSSYLLVKGASDFKMRFEPQKRIKFYSFLIDAIRSFNKNVSIGLCRETPDIWNTLRDRCRTNQCNCVIW